MVGSLHPTPIATLPFLSPHSAVVAFCDGILKHGTAWEALREDLPMQKDGMTLEEVRERMRDVLSLTDITRFPIPKNPSSVIFVAATVADQNDRKRKRVLSEEGKAKKKKKEGKKRAKKNRELGVERLKLPPVSKPKTVTYCRHFLKGSVKTSTTS
ncbi:hypothetical protein POM88_029616 [Heracleum sosnowskyi]|uniref:Uncharacterized protein n=1 Tax=Heracleum sosnowskyi TaxID=360622 RepID=A0AAD8HW39_9APIA|nr:hypothetical protein POM88_029616 [Heracleum sosnowskyi]